MNTGIPGLPALIHASSRSVQEYTAARAVAPIPAHPTRPGTWPHIPHRLYVLARYLTPPKGVWEGPCALIHLPRNTMCRLLFPPPVYP
eukprot:scaffold13528_cov126-Isochrysis_galbana.AAC.7